MSQLVIKIAVLLLLLIPLTYACSNHDEEHKYHGVMDKIEHESNPNSDVGVSSAKYTEDMPTVQVEDKQYKFHVPSRRNAIKSYPCKSCHTKPIEQLKKEEEGKKAHWNIKLHHAGTSTMNCQTCHAKDDMNELKSITGETFSLDHSYKLCGQCHSSQLKDWKGGAHGKRLGGWAPPRKSKTCVNCHNPHEPAFKKRWPARLNTQKIKERKGN